MVGLLGAFIVADPKDPQVDLDTTMVSIGQGATQLVQKQFQNLGTNVIVVMPARKQREGVLSGQINYRRFEAVSDIEVMTDGNLAVLRYRSEIDIHVEGQQPGPLSGRIAG